jgi:hypothetical protein
MEWENNRYWQNPRHRAKLEEKRARLEAICRDKNLYVDEVEVDLTYYDSSFGIGSSNYTGLKEEKFIRYNFLDEHYSIYISAEEKLPVEFNPYEIRDLLRSQGDLQNDAFKRIYVSSQSGIYSPQGGHYVGGWSHMDGNIITFDRDFRSFKNTLPHEGGHNIDGWLGDHAISGDTEYNTLAELDLEARRLLHKVQEKCYHQEGFFEGYIDDPIGTLIDSKEFAKQGLTDISFYKMPDPDDRWDLGRELYVFRGRYKGKMVEFREKPSFLGIQNDDEVWISKYAETKRYPYAPDLTEDWAESVSAYVNQQEWFKTNYPFRYDYIDELFKTYERTGKFELPRSLANNQSTVQRTAQMFESKIRNNLPRIHEIEAPPDPKDEFRRMRKSTWEEFGLKGLDDDDFGRMVTQSIYLRDDFRYGGVQYVENDIKPKLRALILKSWDEGSSSNRYSRMKLAVLKKKYPHYYKKWRKEVEDDLSNILNREYDPNRLTKAQWRQLEAWENDEKEFLEGRDKYGWWENIEPNVKKMRKEFDQVLHDKNLIAREHTEEWGCFGWATKKQFPNLKDEKFIAYSFKDRDYTIYISEDVGMFEYNPYEIRDILDSQPKAVRDSFKRVFVSAQDGIKDANGMGVGGFADGEGDIVSFDLDRLRKRFKQTISHEGGHAVDGLFGKGHHDFSADPEFIEAVERDHEGRRTGQIQKWIPLEGNDEYEKFRTFNSQGDDRIWITKYAETQRYPGEPDLVEDWAESITAYIHTPKWFKENYPNTYRYIDDVFKSYERTGQLKLPKGRLTNRSVMNTTRELFDQKVKQPLLNATATPTKVPTRTSDPPSDLNLKDKERQIEFNKEFVDSWEDMGYESRQEVIDELMEDYEDYIEADMWHLKPDSDYWSTGRALEELFPEETAKIRKKFTKAKDLDRLSPVHRKVYDKLTDLKKNDPKKWKEINKRTGNKLKKRLTKYNKEIKDKTVRTERVTLDHGGHDDSKFQDPSIPKGTTEDYIKYNFTDLDCEIYISTDLNQEGISAQSIREYLLEAPRLERDKFKGICISSKKSVKIEIDGREAEIGGWSDGDGHVFMVNQPESKFLKTLSHEAGHNIDGKEGKLSISEMFVKAHDEDVADIYNGVRKRERFTDKSNQWLALSQRVDKPGPYDGPFVSSYGENDMMRKIDLSLHSGWEFEWDRRMMEEFAECYSAYRHHPQWLKKNYPRTYKVIDDIVKHYNDPNARSWRPVAENLDDIFGKEGQSVVGKVTDMMKGPANRINKVFYKTVPDDLKPAGYDKFKLTVAEERELKKLTKNEDELGFLDRHRMKDLRRKAEFNELHNKKITVGLEGDDIGDYRELVRSLSYDKGFHKATARVNRKKYSSKMFKNKDAFKFTKKQQEVFDELDKEHYQGGDLFDPIEKNEYEILKSQKYLDELHRKALSKGLDMYETGDYIREFKKLRDYGIDLPEISPEVKLTTEKSFFERVYPESYKKIGNEYGLTQKQADELYLLEKEELIIADGESIDLPATIDKVKAKMDPRKFQKLQDLRDQRDFNFLYYYNKEQGGLNYEKTKKYEELFDKFKNKLNLDKSILEQPISNYDHKIKFNADETDFMKFKGTREDGMIPGGVDISEYFTMDPRDMTPRELDVAEDWLGSNYRAFTDFETKCDRDVEKFANYCVECYNKYKQGISGNKYRFYQYYGTYERGLEFAKDIAHDMPVLDSIMDNQLKKGITLWRVQENHHLGDLKIGSIVDFANNRSASITREGALWFEATNGKPMKYIIEIEAPTGTKGCYLAPIKKGTWYGHQYEDHPCSDQAYAREMEDLLKKSKVRIEKVYKRKVKGLTGNELTHIKVRIVESG